jgi:methylphosphotriester-DNA--protein-cysteine methyltransferase
MVSVAFAVPAAELRPFLSTYYLVTIPPGQTITDHLHPEWANLRIALDDGWLMGADAAGQLLSHGSKALLHGPTSGITPFLGYGRSVGVGILPTGWAALFEADASAYADRLVPAEDMLGAAAIANLQHQLADVRSADDLKRIADGFFLDRLGSSGATPYRQQRVAAVLAALNDPDLSSVEALCDHLHLTARQLSLISKAHFGFSPKLLMRRQRFLRMLGAMHARPYGEWRDFIDPLYVDQSHMIREFKYFLGLSPSAYFALKRPLLTAAAAARAKLFGQPLQGLHRLPSAPSREP